MTRERFRDSAAILADYTFEINHSDEDSQQNTLNMQRSAVTTGVGFVRQQGEPGPRILSYSGTILTTSQYDAMMSYAEACATRTIFFRDVEGTEYEVLITSFTPKRERVAVNPRQSDILWKWSYQLQMEIIS